jgi:hypothetical protein
LVAWCDERCAQLRAGIADIEDMNIANSSSVAAAVSGASNSTPGTVGNAASLLVLRKAMDVQESGAAALLAALPQAPALATEGSLGRNVNTYA